MTGGGIQLTDEVIGLKELQRRLKDAPKTIQRHARKGLRDAAKPLIPVARAAAGARLPHKGGLAVTVAALPISIVLFGSRDPGVKIKVKGSDAASTERGRLRHPTYGHRDRWVTQEIKPHWFTDAMRRAAPGQRRFIVEAMNAAAREIAG